MYGNQPPGSAEPPPPATPQPTNKFNRHWLLPALETDVLVQEVYLGGAPVLNTQGKEGGGMVRGGKETRQRKTKTTMFQWKLCWSCGEFWRWTYPHWSRRAGCWYPHMGQLWDSSYLEKGGKLGRWLSAEVKGAIAKGTWGAIPLLLRGAGASLCPPTNQITNQPTTKSLPRSRKTSKFWGQRVVQ